MENKLNLLELLGWVPPHELDYSTWLAVGMSLKYEGYSVHDWDSWSQEDSRYKPGECYTKWETFEGMGTPVTGATITQLAKENGWMPYRKSEDSRELEWDAEIGGPEDYVVIDKNWIEGKEIQEPTFWDPVKELTTYLSILFEPNENVGYVTDTWENDEGKHLPKRGAYDRTAGELIQSLHDCKGDPGTVIGDYNPNAGAWIRFNPLDGQGVKNDNVTEFRYALVESDTMDLEKQNAIIRELELPVAALVYSGKKSIHAIVRVDAGNYDEYRKRVDYLYNVCKKNGLNIDNQNRNPSRLSRMPGVERNGRKQFLIDTNIGKASWEEWHEWIEGINDDLPDPEGLIDTWGNLPELAPPLIEGLLRQGHKMLMAGPSKAGKSFALIELSIAIAEGRQWLGWDCTQGKILYVNLELDRASALHRFEDVYAGLGYAPNNVENIDVWNLRGKSVPMDKLAPKLIRRAQKKNYIAVIIDPIYKVLTGDENSADQMAHFTNQFDKIATELGCSVIYCHHHSKGTQGGKKSMDRASGSGVFARDPDALIDLVELEITDKLLRSMQETEACEQYAAAMEEHNFDYFDEHVSGPDLENAFLMKNHAIRAIPEHIEEVEYSINEALKSFSGRSAWRVEGTLREYAKFETKNMWFEYPVHKIDESGVLNDVEPEGNLPPWKNAIAKRKDPETKKEERIKAFETAFQVLDDGQTPVTIGTMAEYMGVSKKTVRRRLDEAAEFKAVPVQNEETRIERKG